MWLKHVKTIRNNPPIITIDKWYVYHSQSWVVYGIVLPTLVTLWLFNIAMENGPFIDVFPIKPPIYKGFSMAMSVSHNQMVPQKKSGY